VTRIALATALVCLAMAAVLIRMAWQRLGVARQLLRTPFSRLDALPAGRRKLEGALEPTGPALSAPFSDRPVVYVRAAIYGHAPGGGPWCKLWEETRATRARVADSRGSVGIDLAGAQVLVAQEYRHATLHALMRDVRILPQVLHRAGYHTPPRPGQLFHLTEEILRPGQQVTVLADHDGGGTLRHSGTGTFMVSDLGAWRIMLRVAWGPVLALWLATIILVTGATVAATWYWLR
jgi:hypothetical protein